MKRFICLFMSVVLAVGLMPLPAYAELAAGSANFAALDQGDSISDAADAPDASAGDDESIGVSQAAAEAIGEAIRTGAPNFQGLYAADRADEADEAEEADETDDTLFVQDADFYTDTNTGIGYDYEVIGGTVRITSVGANSDMDRGFDLTFPSSIDGKPVTQLGRSEDNPVQFLLQVGGAGSMTIPNTVTSIHMRLALDSNYRYFSNLTKVTFESDSALTTLPDAMFAYSDVNDVALPAGLTSVSEGLFYHCPYLRNVSLPSSVTSIGKNAFAGCDILGFQGNFEIPSQVTTIGEGAFADCPRMTPISIPASVTSIGKGAFSGCTGLCDLTLNEGLQEIGDYAFFNCTSLAAITFPSTLKSIGAGAFTAGSGIDKAGEYEMTYSSISIPDSVESIGAYAFVNQNLTSVQLGSSQAASKLITLGKCAFALSSIAEITLPNSLQSMGNVAAPEVGANGMVYANGAFRSCLALRSIAWPQTSSMTAVAGFDGCTALPDSVLVDLPTYFTSIAPGAFADCAFEDIYIPSTITSIGDYAFALSDSAEDALRSIVFGEEGGPLAIGRRAFAKEHNGKDGMVLKVSEVVLPERVASIGAGAFSGIVTSDEARTTEGGIAYRYYEGPTYTIYNHNVVLGKDGSVFGTDEYEWPFSPAEGVTICYPNTVADGASILKFQNAVQIYENALDDKCANSNDAMYGMTFNHTTFKQIDVPVRHKITGTVPVGAQVELVADGAYEDVPVPASGTFTLRKPEGTAVSAIVRVPGYQAYEVPAPSFSTAAPAATGNAPFAKTDTNTTSQLLGDWTFTVNMSDLKLVQKHTISGTVPAGAQVKLFIGNDEVDATLSSGTTITSRQVDEGTVVGAVISLDGYEAKYLSPETGKSRALLNADWTLNVTTNDMVSLSNVGTLQVTVGKADGSTAKVKGCNVAVFDSAGTLAAQGAVSETGTFVAQELPAGSYTVVAFDKNDYFSAVSSPSDFASLGLDASDYATATVQVTARQVKELELNVPDMNVSKLEGPVATRSVFITSEHIVPNCVFYAHVSYEMNDDHKADELTVKVPAGMEVVSARTAANNTYDVASGSGFDASNRTLTLSGLQGDDRKGSTLYLGLKVSTPGAYSISASLKSESQVVPLGSADIDAPALALQAPTNALSSTSFDAVVYAAPGTAVSFAIGDTQLATTATTNKLGYAKASLTIPEGELTSYSYYTLKATATDASAQAILNYNYLSHQESPVVQQFSFKHAGEDIYLVKDGKDVSGGYYTCLVAPSSHPSLYSPTWDFTAVIDSARTLDNVVTLQMEMLDSSIRYEKMQLAGTANLNDGLGTKRYTYRASVLVGTGNLADNLKSSDIPRAFDIAFDYSSSVAVGSPPQSVIDTMKARSLLTQPAWTAELRDASQKTTGQELGDLTPERREEIEDILFNGGYKHEKWNDDGLMWNAVFTAEDRATYLEFEAAMDEAVNSLGKGLGGKPLDQYGNAKAFLQDVLGYQENPGYTRAQLQAKGYTIIYDSKSAASTEDGYYAPSWHAIRYNATEPEQFDENSDFSTQSAESDDALGSQSSGSDDALTSRASSSDAAFSTQSTDEGDELAVQNDFEDRMEAHYSYYSDSLGFMIGDGITHVATSVDVDLGKAALYSSRAGTALTALNTIPTSNIQRCADMTEEARWLVQQSDVSGEAFSYIFKRDFGMQLSENQIRKIADGALENGVSNKLMQRFDGVAGVLGDACTVVGTASGIGAAAQSSAELQSVEDRRAAINGEMDGIELQLGALRRANDGKLPGTDLAKAYLAELQAASRLRAVYDDDSAVYYYDSIVGGICTTAGATGAGGVPAWGASEAWEWLKGGSEYQQDAVRDEIMREYEQARLKRKQIQDIEADRKRQEEKLRYAMIPIMDPSGYVYAGVDGNRLSGVTATIFQVAGSGAGEVLTQWAAADYNQQNAQTTGAGGLYGWDVTSGVWRVKFELDGYDVAWSDDMDVPPEWTNVAINLLASDARVASITRSGNYALITFVQYMKLSAPPTVTIAGTTVAGTWTDAVEGVNESKNKELMARTLRVPIPSSAKGKTVEVSVSGGKSYAGKDLTTASVRMAVPADAPAYQTMHRLYNPYSGEHFYTASASEKNHLVSVGWRYEGEGWKAPLSGADVYRLYNPYAGDHHYTPSAAERDSLVRVGWRYEGVGWKSGGSTPLYRQYNPYAEVGTHNYTTSKAENDNLVRVGWRPEGIGWYGV